MNDIVEECPLCLQKGYFQKMVSKPKFNLRVEDNLEPKEKVEKHIEAAQKELDEQKRALKKEDILDK